MLGRWSFLLGGFVMFSSHIGVSKNRGTPKWMVKIMENPMNKWMIWGVNTTIFGNIHINQLVFLAKNVCNIAPGNDSMTSHLHREANKQKIIDSKVATQRNIVVSWRIKNLRNLVVVVVVVVSCVSWRTNWRTGQETPLLGGISNKSGLLFSQPKNSNYFQLIVD